MSVTVTRGFYVTGGTLRQGAPSYVERQADKDLYEGLMQGEFCYVLTSRQMGKSSLMVRTAARLRAEGVRVAVLDLTAVGQNLTPEQWYEGLLGRLARGLDLEDELEEFWEKHERGGALHRWMAALEDVVLKARGQGSGVGGQTPTMVAREAADPWPLTPDPSRLVIFVDEIDAVGSLPFSADEFFAGIRECYNRRTQDSRYERLTFCLLGVATPAELIQNARATPFNIGRRIELLNFTPAEAGPLAMGLGVGCSVFGVRTDPTNPTDPTDPTDPTRTPNTEHPTPNAPHLLRRILDWTGGHPYLTQRLCQAVADRNADPTNPKSQIENPKSVDRLCEEMFLTRKARETEDNLTFVRHRLLNSGVDLAALLELYRKVWSGKPVADDDASPLVSVLKLSGVVRPQGKRKKEKGKSAGRRYFCLFPFSFCLPEGSLQVGNRIYARVFDRAWTTENMPDAERRRQRRAFWGGVVRTTLVSAAIIAVISTLALLAVSNARSARHSAARATAEGRRANQMLVQFFEREGVRLMDEGDPATSLIWFLEAMRRQGDHSRDEVQRVRIAALLRACPRPLHVWFLPNSSNGGVFTPDGRRVVMTSYDPSKRVGELRIWDAQSRAPVSPPIPFPNAVGIAAFSPDGRRLLTTEGGEARIEDAQTGRALAPPMKLGVPLRDARFSADGRCVLTAGYDRRTEVTQARAWDAWTGRALGSPIKRAGQYQAIEFSEDGRRLFLAMSSLSTNTNDARWWDTQTGMPLTPPLKLNGPVRSTVLSKDGRRLATGIDRADTGELQVWDAHTCRALTPPRDNQDILYILAFSSDGSRLLSAGNSSQARVWDTRTGQRLATIETGARVQMAALSPDGTRVLTAGPGTTVQVWDAQTGQRLPPPLEHGGRVSGVAFSADGTRLLTASDDRTLRVWKLGAPPPLILPGSPGQTVSLARFSGDGRRVLTASDNDDETHGEARVWNARTGQPLTPPMKYAGGVAQARFSPDGRRVVMVSGGVMHQRMGELRVWDAQTGKPLTPPMRLDARVFTADLSPDGTRVVTVRGDYQKHLSEARVWDVQTGKPVTAPMKLGWIGTAAFSVEGQRVLTGGGYVIPLPAVKAQIWDAQTGKPLVAMKQAGQVGSVRFSPDGQRVVTASFDRTARVWDARTGNPLTPPMLHTAAIWYAGFSPDGRHVVTGLWDGTTWIWDAVTGRRLLTLVQHQGIVGRVAFSRDGRQVLTGSTDQTARVWDGQTGQPLTPPLQNGGDPMSIEFSPDGRRVLTGTGTPGARGGARVWDVSPDNRPLGDLILLSQALSSHRLDEQGVLVPLGATEFRRVWERLRSRYPGESAEPAVRSRSGTTGTQPLGRGKP